jgi:hypothetical protein
MNLAPSVAPLNVVLDVNRFAVAFDELEPTAPAGPFERIHPDTTIPAMLAIADLDEAIFKEAR